MSDQPPNESNIAHLPAVPGPGAARALQPYDPYNAEYAADDEIDLRELWNILVKYRWTILVFMAFALTVTAIGTKLMHPVYKATTLLELVPNSGNIVKFQNLEQMEYQPREFAQTQANILRSESVAAAAIASLGIEDHPEMNGELAQRGILNGVSQLRSLFSTPEEIFEEHALRVAEPPHGRAAAQLESVQGVLRELQPATGRRCRQRRDPRVPAAQRSAPLRLHLRRQDLFTEGNPQGAGKARNLGKGTERIR